MKCLGRGKELSVQPCREKRNETTTIRTNKKAWCRENVVSVLSLRDFLVISIFYRQSKSKVVTSYYCFIIQYSVVLIIIIIETDVFDQHNNNNNLLLLLLVGSLFHN